MKISTFVEKYDEESDPFTTSQSTHGDDFNMNVCFPISEAGENNRKHLNRPQKIINYKSPIPKSKLGRAILTDNIGDERSLKRLVHKLSTEKKKLEHLKDRHKVSFFQAQERKKIVWQKEDEQQLQRLNLPQLHQGNRALMSPSLTKIYQAPQNLGPPMFSVPLSAVMVGDDERRIVEHAKQIFITRLPTIVELSAAQKHRYQEYKGTKLLESRTVQDRRFASLYNALSERKSASKPKKKFFLTRASTIL